MATPSLAAVGNSAGSPELIRGPSPATGHDPAIFDVYGPYVGYDAETFPHKPAPTDDEIHLSYRAVGRVMWNHVHLLKR
jgi:hypothetical protein